MIEMPDIDQLLATLIHLLVAALAGAAIGLQRERQSKPAGLRTHMLVAMGTAFFVLIPTQAGLSPEGISRVIQGVVTGTGFIGGGVILKLSEYREVRGLTTAGSLWVTAAIGVAVGLGQIGAVAVGVVLTLFILSILGWLENRIEKKYRSPATDSDHRNQ
jgi:putative Mg2+ transporter-C (MgtC) family protein